MNFDTILPRDGLCTSKWEFEFERKQDKTLLPFGTADMDFKSAQPIIDALIAAAQRGHYGYPYKPESYYESIINYHERKFGWKIEKEWIQSGVGIYSSMGALVQELTEEGDRILYMTPVHHIFSEVITANHRVAVPVALKPAHPTYEIDFEKLRESIKPGTKLLFLCNPHNPMGRIWNREELIELHEICSSNGIIIISDEVYAGLVYKNEIFTPMASISQAASLNTITVTSASKSFNLTGLKHSLVVTESIVLQNKYLDAQRRTNMYYGGSTFGIIATEMAMSSVCDEWSRDVIEYVEENLRYAQEFFGKYFPDVLLYKPQSTYFLWADFSSFNMSNEELMSFFENKAHIIVSNGLFLGKECGNYIRFNLGCPREQLARGLERIMAAKYNCGI